jgi:hypothetical protein
MVEENTMAIFDAFLENEPHSAIVFLDFFFLFVYYVWPAKGVLGVKRTCSRGALEEKKEENNKKINLDIFLFI